jgi:hypothetical protein
MTRVLHVANIVAVILTGVVIVSLGESGLLRPGAQREGQIGAFLNGPSVMDRFKQQSHGSYSNQGESTPSIIRQAELFASIINPPQRADANGGPVPPPPPPPPPPPWRPDFALMGTSHSPGSGLSFAYVRLIDQTFRWVRPGDRVRHTTINEIQDGSIVYSNTARNGVMAVELAPQTAALIGPEMSTRGRP